MTAAPRRSRRSVRIETAGWVLAIVATIVSWWLVSLVGSIDCMDGPFGGGPIDEECWQSKRWERATPLIVLGAAAVIRLLPAAARAIGDVVTGRRGARGGDR